MGKTLASLGEFGLIERLKRRLPELPRHRWTVGIGDDTSVLRLSENHYQLLSHDLLLEGVHFLPGPPKIFSHIGWKALAVNLSDIAAMGGIPQEAVVGLGIPRKAQLTQVDAFYRGLSLCSKKYHCPVVGGDTNLSKGGWVFSVSVTGFRSRPPLTRSGARPGDSLWVTGKLGTAHLGLQFSNKKKLPRGASPYLKKFFRPEPRLLAGQRLADTGWVSAMIDLSDGITGDLGHLSQGSGVGFKVEVTQIPRLKNFSDTCRTLRLNPLGELLGGGEDYELLFTVRRDKNEEFKKWLKTSQVEATCIGQAIPGNKTTWLESGKPLGKLPRSFQHF